LEAAETADADDEQPAEGDELQTPLKAAAAVAATPASAKTRKGTCCQQKRGQHVG
jgi:hypothetical protein